MVSATTQQADGDMKILPFGAGEDGQPWVLSQEELAGLGFELNAWQTGQTGVVLSSDNSASNGTQDGSDQPELDEETYRMLSGHLVRMVSGAEGINESARLGAARLLTLPRPLFLRVLVLAQSRRGQGQTHS